MVAATYGADDDVEPGAEGTADTGKTGARAERKIAVGVFDGMTTHIEWTDETWNPVTGCSKVSQGCKHCYAETMWKRLSAKNMPYEGRDFTDVWCHPERLDMPSHWKKPRMVFVNSMSDLFHENVPKSFIDEVFCAMGDAPQHTFQILTKRPERMRAYMHSRLYFTDMDAPKNIWLGVSAEDQDTADERIPILLDTPATIRFVSAEPLLGRITFRWASWVSLTARKTTNHLDGLRLLDWVIVGGESGPGSRQMRLHWAEEVVEQCSEADVPCFVKQLGSSFHDLYDGRRKLNHPKGADMAEWPEHLRVRQMPVVV